MKIGNPSCLPWTEQAEILGPHDPGFPQTGKDPGQAYVPDHLDYEKVCGHT